MTRNALLLIVAATIGLLTFAGVSKFFDGRTIDQLKDRLSVQKVEAAATDVLIDRVRRQAATDSANADSVVGMYAALRDSLTDARETTSTAIVRVVTVRSTINEDTLTAGLRTLLAAEREVCNACAAERNLERTRADKAESDLRLIRPRLDSARKLLFAVRAERDRALDLSGDAIAATSPNFFSKLFQDLPRKAACAGAGAIVAEVNDGKALTGAAIALGVCLAFEALF